MKVLELELENFARVYTGLGKTNLLLDLRELKNRIKLFVGANGTGKTSIMGCIHPYAFNNHTSDNRDNADLITPEKSGKKRILIQDDHNLFEINHIYKRDSKGGISVKSFISKNMVELNENGNVGSFKAIVESELGITEQYLILLSLGNSIDGFIDMSTSDRKNFVIKLFEELGIYSELYKKKSNDVRALKSILGNITYKLDKFKTMNVDDLKKASLQLERQIQLLEQDHKFIMTEIGQLRGNISNYSETITDYSMKQNQLATLLTDISISKRKLSSIEITDTVLVEREISVVGEKIKTLEIEKQALINNIQNKLDIIDNLNNSLYQDKSNLSKLETHESTTELTQLITKLEIDLGQIQSIDISSISSYDKTNLVRANVYLDELRSMMTDLILFNDDELVLKLVESTMKTPGLDTKVNGLISQANGKLLNLNLLSGSSVSSSDISSSIGNFVCSEDDGCPYKQFHKSFVDIIENRQLDKKEYSDNAKMEVVRLEKTRDIIYHIKKLNSFIDSNITKFNLSIDIFNPDTYIHQYMQDRTIYNGTLLIDIIDKLEMVERRDSISEKLEMYKSKYDNIISNKDIIDSMTDNIISNGDKLRDAIAEKDKFSEQLAQVSVSLEEELLHKDGLETDLSILKTISQTRESINRITQEIRDMSDTMDKITELKDRLKTTEEHEMSIDKQIKDARHNKQQVEISINEMASLTNEYEDIKYKYDIMLEIKDSLSPTKGIPLKFIEDYIRDMASDVNELLYVVYKGRIKLIPDEIVVDDKSFDIPYMSKGAIVQDISNASDGERAIIALAFSLVLSKMSISGYNIMLLDELDTALDDESRGRFIQILETYLDIIGAEDVYIISHNNMFDMYDVSVIMTSDKNVYNISEENKLRIY